MILLSIFVLLLNSCNSHSKIHFSFQFSLLVSELSTLTTFFLFSHSNPKYGGRANPSQKTLTSLYSVKLDRGNYLLWKSLVLPMIRGCKLDAFILSQRNSQTSSSPKERAKSQILHMMNGLPMINSYLVGYSTRWLKMLPHIYCIVKRQRIFDKQLKALLVLSHDQESHCSNLNSTIPEKGKWRWKNIFQK